jgi:hypothetical protein
MTGEALVAIHRREGLLAVMAHSAEFPGLHLIHAQLVAPLLHLEYLGMAVGTGGPSGKMLRVLEGDGPRRTGIGREGEGGRT